MPEGKEIRPTPGKVKEAVFSMVGHDLTDTYVLDLFAGTGSLGLEAVSRGAEFVWLGDSSVESCQLISENIKTTGAGDRAKLIRGEWTYLINFLKKSGQKLDVIFLDPPYHEKLLVSAIEAISHNQLLSDDGIIVAEHDRKLILPEKIGDFVCCKSRKYGHSLVSLYGYESENTDDSENVNDFENGEEQ